MNSPLVFRVVSRLFLIILFLGTFFPQTPLWAMSSAQNAPNAPDAFPLQIPLTGVVQIAANGDFTCVLTNKGGVKCWGFNNQGQLGDGTTETRLTAVDVSGLGSGVKAIAAGSIHACALLTGGGVKCWGNNSAGQIGDGPLVQIVLRLSMSLASPTLSPSAQANIIAVPCLQTVSPSVGGAIPKGKLVMAPLAQPVLHPLLSLASPMRYPSAQADLIAALC